MVYQIRPWKHNIMSRPLPTNVLLVGMNSPDTLPRSVKQHVLRMASYA